MRRRREGGALRLSRGGRAFQASLRIVQQVATRLELSTAAQAGRSRSGYNLARMAFEIIVAPVAVKSLRKLPAHIRAEVKSITLSSCVVLPRRVQQFMKVVESDSKMHRAAGPAREWSRRARRPVRSSRSLCNQAEVARRSLV